MTVRKCPKCKAVLSEWEPDVCSCDGPARRTNGEVLYAVACDATTPLRTADFVRVAEQRFDTPMSLATATAMMAPDPRFCWAGSGLYGLYRHGPLPGPRNLEEAARLVLVTAGRPLHREVVEYCLKQLGYRFSSASLRNAVRRSASISWSRLGDWDHPTSEAAQLALRGEIPVVPPRRRAAWEAIRRRTASQVQHSIRDREKRLRALADTRLFGIDWE